MFRHPFRVAALAVIAVSITLPFFLGCGGKSTSANWPKTDGPRVAVSFAPYYCFAANVVGEKGAVKSILTSQGPHHADMNVQERVLLEEADLFFTNGLGLDDSLAKGLQGSTGNKKLKIVELGEKLEHQYLLESDGTCCVHDQKPGEKHEEHVHDPHCWTSPVVAQKLVELIRTAVRTAEPQYASTYDKNAADYIAKLKELTADGKKLLKEKKNRGIVTMHGSMRYFANCFDLEIVGVLQKTPGQDLNPADFKALIDECVKKQVRVIAIEPQYAASQGSKRLKEELDRAGIADVQIVELDPLETAMAIELNSGWYEAKTRANLEALAKVMR